MLYAVYGGVSLQAFSALEEELTAYEIVAFRLKAESELLHEANTADTAATATSNSNSGIDGDSAAVAKQSWGAWLLGRGAAKTSGTSSSSSADVAVSETSSDAGDVDAARDEFLRAFAEDDTATATNSTSTAANDSTNDSTSSAQQDDSSSSSSSTSSAISGLLLTASMSLNDVALTLISGDAPCLRILWDTAVSGTLAQSGEALLTH
jgi:hypothetical protein